MNKKWKDYEIFITNHFRKLYPNALISYDVKKTGIISKTTRQIDPAGSWRRSAQSSALTCRIDSRWQLTERH